MEAVFAIRAAFLLLPTITLTVCFTRRQYTTREKAGSFLAFAWQGIIGLAVMILGVRQGWWQFSGDEGVLYQVPLDIVMGQAMTAGGLAALCRRKQPYFSIGIACIFIGGTYYFMPFIHLMHPAALFFLLLLVVVPSLFLAHWTASDTRLYARALLQPIIWAAVLLWIIPTLLLVQTGIGWKPFLERPLPMNVLYCIPLFLPAYLIINALNVFARDGGGTGFPYDPPKRLVTSGVYAHISNPMQLGICLLMAWWGVVVGCIYVSLTSLVALMLFTVFKNICNGSSQVGKTDPRWNSYQSSTPKWWFK